MKRFALLALALSCLPLAAARAAPPPEVRLWRLDCGKIEVEDLDEFSDTFAYAGRSLELTVGCYLIRHGDTYMLWDAGLPDEDLGLPLRGAGSNGSSVSVLLVDQLRQVGVDPAQVRILGISHYHYDHTGQAAHFPQARLLMGRGDVQALRSKDNPSAKPLEHWLGGQGALEEIDGDKDVFGDGTVVMLNLPGHTPGHHGLLVRLARTGPVLLSGDLAHFRENYEADGVPIFNTDRSQTLASLDRFKKMAKNLHALVILQHEATDVDKLPRFPDSAQ
jgi:glyoxylase-like metal-dependent hydrolase (beta-lactamase superfamily II)